MDIKIDKKTEILTEITGSIPTDVLNTKKKIVLEKYAKNKEFDGFRKGTTPVDVVEKKMGTVSILEEVARSVIIDEYAEIVFKNKIDAIGFPQIQLTKVTEGTPIEFKLIVSTLPEIKLPDYRTIAKQFSLEKGDVTEDDLNNTLNSIRKGLYYEQNPDERGKEVPEDKLPEITDETIQKISSQKTVEEFKKALQENMKKEKELFVKNKLRTNIADALIKETNFDIPDTLAEVELDKMFAQLKEDSKSFNTTLEGYLEHIKKTEEELKKEWRPLAEGRAKLQLILSEIAKKENLFPTEEEVNKEFDKLKAKYPEVDDLQIKAYLNIQMTNEKVFELLEN